MNELKDLAKSAVTGDGLSKEERSLAGKILFVYGWRASAFMFFLWSLGALGRFNLGGGFAYSQETQEAQTSVERRLSAIERRLLEQDIMVTLKESCAAPHKEYFRERLRGLQNDYADKIGNGRWLQLPQCETLGITPNG